MTYDVALKRSIKDFVFRPLITYYAMRTLEFVLIEVHCNRINFADQKCTSIVKMNSILKYIFDLV